MFRGFAMGTLLGVSLFLVGCGGSPVEEDVMIEANSPEMIQKQMDASKNFVEHNKANEAKAGDEISSDVGPSAGVGKK